MAKLGSTYDPSAHDPNQAFDPLPAGWYAAQIVASETRPTKDNESTYLWLEIELLEAVHPDNKGRKVWDRLNLWNKNPQATDIANRTLSAIAHAVGLGTTAFDDSEILHGKPLAVKVKVRPAQGDFDAQNEVSGYEAYAARFGQGAPVAVSATPGAAGAPAPGAAAPAPGAPPATPPWQKPS